MAKRKFKAMIVGENQFGKMFKRTLIVVGETARRSYSELKGKNDVLEIISFKEIK